MQMLLSMILPFRSKHFSNFPTHILPSNSHIKSMDNCYFPKPHNDRNQLEMLMMMNQFQELSESATIANPPTFYKPISANQFQHEFLLQAPRNELPTEPNYSTETMREMIFKIRAMQPIEIDPERVKPPKRRNVKISKDPQSMAARQRRGRISEKIRILQRLVPGGMKMDTASMLDEAICYVKFLKKQIVMLENGGGGGGGGNGDYLPVGGGHPAAGMGGLDYSCLVKGGEVDYMVEPMNMLS